MKRGVAPFLLALSALSTAGGAPATGAQPASGATGLTVVDRMPAPIGGWDYVTLDAARRRIYVANGDSVVSIDIDARTLNPTFAKGRELHMVLPVPGTGMIAATNSGDNSVKLFDAGDGHLVKSITVGNHPDGMTWEPHSRLLAAVNFMGGDITLVDPSTQAAVGTITIGGNLETAVPDGKGRLFVNVYDKGELAVVDVASRKVVMRYPLAGCFHPSGLLLISGRLVIACGSDRAKIIDAATGREIASPPLGRYPDQLFYDARRQLVFAPTSDGKMTVIAMTGPHANSVVETLDTQTTARTGAVDPRTGRVFVPAAEFLPAKPGTWPATKPGTFRVLVLDRN